MKRAEQIACLVWIAIAVAMCVGSVGLGLGSPAEPKSGFLPFWTALLLGALALVHLVRITVGRGVPAKAAAFLGEVKWKQGLWVVVALLAYTCVLEFLGYLIATFLLLLTLFSLCERKRWWLSLLLSGVAVGISYVVFRGWLTVQLPLGLLGG
jgi:hypothetical protein